MFLIYSGKSKACWQSSENGREKYSAAQIDADKTKVKPKKVSYWFKKHKDFCKSKKVTQRILQLERGFSIHNNPSKFDSFSWWSAKPIFSEEIESDEW